MGVMSQCESLCVFAGAPHRERGGRAAEGEAPQHHHAGGGGGHGLGALPGHGARQGSGGGTLCAQSSSLFTPLIWNLLGAGRRSV